MEGQGRCYYRDKRIKYEGDWKNSKWNGNGTFYDNDGVTYKGKFQMGKRHGLFTIMPNSDDVEIECLIQDDKLIIEKESHKK